MGNQAGESCSNDAMGKLIRTPDTLCSGRACQGDQAAGSERRVPPSSREATQTERGSRPRDH
jgi:hypothetical protein